MTKNYSRSVADYYFHCGPDCCRSMFRGFHYGRKSAYYQANGPRDPNARPHPNDRGLSANASLRVKNGCADGNRSKNSRSKAGTDTTNSCTSKGYTNKTKDRNSGKKRDRQTQRSSG